MEMKTEQMIIGAAALVIILAAAYYLLNSQPVPPAPFHIHADFKVYLNGTAFNFSQAKFMSTDNASIDKKVHFHDMDGDIIHYHAKNVTLAYVFGTLNMTYNSSCFVTDNRTAYCDDQDDSLRMLVRHTGGSWTEVQDGPDYVAVDLDQILITYGPAGSDISSQEASVTDKACIESQKCPERGNATDLTCAGDVCNAPT